MPQGPPTNPGAPSQPATGWYPNLRGTGAPAALQNGMQQSFSLLYSLRDTVNQQAQTIAKVIQYDTHLSRLNTTAQAMPDCGLWFESDRNTAFYMARLAPQQTTRAWFYQGGIYADLFQNQPTDLSDNDLGFLFLAIDQKQLYRWDGKAWSTV